MIRVFLGALLASTCIEAQPVELTYNEAQLLMKVAQAESGNQGADGQWLTMSVVINRINSPEFPATLEEVVYQPGQFSTVTSGAIYTVEPTTETHEALARIESGDVAKEIIAFETTASNALDAYFNSCFEYRDHRFYTLKNKNKGGRLKSEKSKPGENASGN